MRQREPSNKVALLSFSQWTSDRLWFGKHLLLTWKASEGSMLEGDGRYDREPLILLMWGFPGLMGSEGKIELECEIITRRRYMKCVWICLHCIRVVKLSFFPLSIAFLLYCLVVQPLISFAGEKGPDARREFGRYISQRGTREAPAVVVQWLLLSLRGYTAQQHGSGFQWETRWDLGIPCVSLMLL